MQRLPPATTPGAAVLWFPSSWKTIAFHTQESLSAETVVCVGPNEASQRQVLGKQAWACVAATVGLALRRCEDGNSESTAAGGGSLPVIPSVCLQFCALGCFDFSREGIPRLSNFCLWRW